MIGSLALLMSRRLCCHAPLYSFADEDGGCIPEVTFTPPIRRLPDLKADRYGRVVIRLAKGEEVHVTAEHVGYAPEKVDLLTQAKDVSSG